MIFTNQPGKFNPDLGKKLPPEVIRIIKQALDEDASGADITSKLIIPKNTVINAVLTAHQESVICGLKISECVFKLCDPAITFRTKIRDGKIVTAGTVVARLRGNARAILGAERLALNLLSRLSGIADKTRMFVNILKPFKTKILDTRKTTPNIRLLEKYAVRVGGGQNHRYNLSDMVLIKENHLKVLSQKGGLLNLHSLIARKRANLPRETKIEIEAQSLQEFYRALESKCDIIMLDNMSLREIRKAAKIAKIRGIKVEVSGNITAENVSKIAACGVDYISTSKLNRYLRHLDISLDIVP